MREVWHWLKNPLCKELIAFLLNHFSSNDLCSFIVQLLYLASEEFFITWHLPDDP